MGTEGLAVTHIRSEQRGAASSTVMAPAPTIGIGGSVYAHQGDPGVRVIGSGTNPRSAAEAHLKSYRDLTDEPCTTIAAEQIGNAGPWLSRPSPAVVCSEVKGSGPGGSPEKMQRASDDLYLATGRRRLTVEECAILQDFPVGHPFQGTKSAQYRQVGNAVPPKLAEVVGRMIAAYR